jgi:hypothetical protein
MLAEADMSPTAATDGEAEPITTTATMLSNVKNTMIISAENRFRILRTWWSQQSVSMPFEESVKRFENEVFCWNFSMRKTY